MGKFGLFVDWFVLISFIIIVLGVLLTEGWNGQVKSSIYLMAGVIVILAHIELIITRVGGG